MLRLLVWALLIYIAYRFIVSLAGKGNRADLPRGRDAAAATHQDPVCGIYVSEEDAVVGRLGDQRHYFCSHACLERFREQLDHTPTQL